MMLFAADCTDVDGMSCPDGEAFGSDKCRPMDVDCPSPTTDPTPNLGAGDLLQSLPWILVVLFLLVAVGLLAWLTVEMSRRRAAEGKANAAVEDAADWRASAHAAAQSRAPDPDVPPQLLEQLVSLTDFPHSAGVSAQLEQVLAAAGLVPLTANPGDPFDETIHRAQVPRDTTNPAQNRTIAEVIRSGYRTANGIVRPADVSVWITR